MSERVVPIAERWQERWHRLLEWLGAPAALAGAGERLFGFYSEPGRCYHDARHVLDCLDQLEAYPEAITDPDAVELALWYHDAIYDPSAQDNEAKSAALYQREFGDYLSDRVNPRLVDDLILATRHRFRPATPDEGLIMDIDMATLGAEKRKYARYADAVREEFGHLDPAAFSKGRADFLKAMLSREQLYWTRHFRGLYEEEARKNMVDELDALVGR